MKTKFLKKQDGQAMVEFALVFSLFITIVFFIIDFGWITYQKSVFEFAYTHSSWNISRTSIGDSDPIENVGSVISFSGPAVSNEIRRQIEALDSWAFDSTSLTITNSVARFRNEETTYDVPGNVEGDGVPATSYTRYMKLTADLSYDIYPLTPIGEAVFGSVIRVDKKLDFERIIGASHRSK